MEKSIRLKLYFKDADNSQRTVSIDRPRASYTDEEINQAMDQMVAANVIKAGKGLVEAKTKAEMETIEKSAYEITKA